MKAAIWVILVVLAFPITGHAQWDVPAMPTLPSLPTLGESTQANRRLWQEQSRESGRFLRQLRDERRWREAEEAKQRRHEETLEEMRQQHWDDMTQRENEYRARFGARDRNCLLGRGPVLDC